MDCENASDLGNLLAMFEAVGEHSKRQGLEQENAGFQVLPNIRHARK